MNISTKDVMNNNAVLNLTGELTINTIRNSKDQLLNYLKKYNSIILDTKGIVKIDTSGYQLLAFLKRESKKNGKKISLVNHSDAVLHMIDLYGGAGYFGDKIKIQKSKRNEFKFTYGFKKSKKDNQKR